MTSPPDGKSTSPKPSDPSRPSAANGAPQKTTATSPVLTKVEPSAAADEKKANAPLAPPPKPNQPATDTPDYFSGAHNSTHLYEPNPFEQSFGNPSSETPGRAFGATLPSVASLTSPAPVGPGGTPGWQNSLRSGPLSPAMLPGPTGYFDENFRGSFPTPNESSLRTGLTPGGPGSMFPAPSPNSQAVFNHMQNGGATPGTLEFHRTAMNAAARNKSEATNGQKMGSTAQGINQQDYKPAQQSHQGHEFNNHTESDAVNGLFMLQQAGNRSANQFAVPTQPQTVNAQTQRNMGAQELHQRPGKQSIGSVSGSNDMGEYDGSDGEQKPSSRSKSKKGAKGNGRRKTDDTPIKGGNKRSKGNNGMPNDMSPDDSDDGSPDQDDDQDLNVSASGRKLTDEEKRKNFLERNRVAALKCRQRKKQWLANLQHKVEAFTSENDALASQNQELRQELVNLKTLLIAHKDCPVSHQQGLGGANMASVIGDLNPHANPYSMGNMIGMGQGMQRS